MIAKLRRFASSRPLLAVLAAALVLGTSGSLWKSDVSTRTFTVEFTEVKGLYVGDDVDLLGVRIGEVTDIEAEPDKVVVTIEVDADQRIPADAKAVLTAPSVVPVRHVALTPVYDGGPELRDGDTIPISRTVVPVEWDEVKSQLVRLTTSLGPQGANKDGALSRLLETSAANLGGQGDNLNETIQLLTEAMATLADSGGDVFGTVRNLQVFVAALEASDVQVTEFNRSIASVAGILAADRDDLAGALRSLDEAFVGLRRFVRDNREDLTSTVEGLGRASNLLARNRQKLADILQVAPGTVTNFYNIYDPDAPAVTGSFALPNMESPAMFVCSMMFSLGGTPDQCAAVLEPIAQYLQMPFPPLGLGSPQTPGGDNNHASPDTTANLSPGSPDLIDLLDQLGPMGGHQ